MKKISCAILAFLMISTISFSQIRELDFNPEGIEVTGELGDFSVELTPNEIEPGLYIIDVKMSADEAATPPQFSLKWTVPSVDISSIWTPQITVDKKKAASKLSIFDSKEFNPLCKRFQLFFTLELNLALSFFIISLNLFNFIQIFLV